MQVISPTASIFVTFRSAAFHSWPGASGNRMYLGQVHRHLFGVRVETTVKHDDREIEFHDLLAEAEKLFDACGASAEDKGAMSCEALAREIATKLAEHHERAFQVTVDEDGECGASVWAWPYKRAPASAEG